MARNNLGLVAGRVYSVGGGAVAPNVRVVLTNVTNSQGGPLDYGGAHNEKFVETMTNAQGLFWLRFAWAGADRGDLGLNFGHCTVTAMNEVNRKEWFGSSSATTSHAVERNLRLAVFRDFAALMRTAGSTFGSAPETMDFAVDLWAGIRDVKMYPVWKYVSLLSTESWAMAAGLEMTLTT